MSDYVKFKKKSEAVAVLKGLSEPSETKLFADDLGTKGAKTWLLSTDDKIYTVLYTRNGILKGHKSFYEVFCDDHQIAFGIDGDFKTTENAFLPDYDCAPELLTLIQKVNAFVYEKFKIVTTLRDWIITKAPYCKDKKKHSFHLKLVTVCFDTVKDVKDFAVALDMEEEGVDYSIYRKQPYRLTGCTKAGQRRQLSPYKLSAEGKSSLMPNDFSTHLEYWKATLLTNTKDYTPVTIPQEMRKSTVSRLKHRNKRIVDLELGDLMEEGCDMSMSTINGLMNCISTARAEQYPQWFNVCSALQRTRHPDKAELFRLFDQLSKKCPAKYDAEEVKKMWNDCSRSIANAPEIGADQLLNIARKDNASEYWFVMDTTHLPQLLAKEFEVDYTQFPSRGKSTETKGLRIEYQEYNEKHCKPIPKGYDIVIQIAGMGVGKSFSVLDYIRKRRPKRIIKLSPRIKYSEDAQRRYAEADIDMKLYWQQEGTLSDLDNLIISPESIYRLFKNRTYDVFDFDEIESILRQLSSDTMENLPQSHLALLDILNKAKKVIVSDAHFSQRSLEFLQKVFAQSDKRILIMRNTHKAVRRSAIEHVMVEKGHQNLTKNQDKFIDSILEDLKKGKNIGVHATSKRFADRLAAAVEASGILKPEQYRYYHGKQSGNQARKTGIQHDYETEVIENVNVAWKGLRLVIWTPVITVGLSYDCDAKQVKKDFDCMYIYLTAKSVNANVAMQGCQRIRHLQDDLVHFMIDDLPTRVCVSSLEAADHALERRRKEMEDVYEEIMTNHNSTPNWMLKDIMEEYSGDAAGALAAITELIEEAAKSPALQAPEILRQTLAFNKLENDLHHMHLRGFFYDALAKEGYDVVERRNVEVDAEQASALTARDMVEHSFASLPLITAETNEEYINKRKKHTDTTFTNAAVDKFMFVNKLVKEAPVSAEDQEKLFDDFQVDDKHKQWLFHGYNICRRVPRDILIKDMKKRPFLETTKADGAVTYRIRQILELLGLSNCHDTQKVVSRERIEDNQEQLLLLIESSKLLMDRPKIETKTADERAANSTGDFRKITRGIKTIFTTWLGVSFENSAERGAKVASKTSTEYRLSYVDEFSSLLYTCGLC